MMPKTATNACRAQRRWQFKRYLPGVLFITFIQFLTLALPWLLRQWKGKNPDPDGYFSIELGILYPIALILSAYLVHQFFSFLHQQDRCNQYFSLPLSRCQLFLQQNAVLFILILIPRLGALAQGWMIYGMAGRSFQEFMLRELAIFISVLASTYFLELFYLLSATSVHAILLFLLSNVFWPLAVLPGIYVAIAMLPGCAWLTQFYSIGRTLPLYAVFLSPILSILDLSLQAQLYWLAFALLAWLLSGFLFCRRPAEKATSPLWENPAYWPIRIIASSACGFALAIVFSEIRHEASEELETLPAFLIGLFAGSLISGLILDLILTRGSTDIRRKILCVLLSWGILIFPVGWMILGGFGYSARVPQLETLQSIAIQGENAVSGTLPRLTFSEKASLEELTERFRESYQPDLPGMEIPRDLFSARRYMEALEERGISGVDYDMSWREDGRQIRRLLRMNPERDLPEIYEKDPGLRLLCLLSYTSKGILDEGLIDCERSALLLEDSLPDEEREILEAFERSWNRGRALSSELLDSLYYDYARLNESQRRELDDEKLFTLHLIFDISPYNDFYSYDRFSVRGPEHRSYEGFDSLYLPVSRNCEKTLAYMKGEAESAKAP